MEKKSIATDSLKLSIAQLFSLVMSMINVMLLSRFRTVSEYGTYSQMLMVSSVAVTFFASGFSQCINYFLADEKDIEKEKAFVKTYYFIISFAGILCGLISFSLIPVLASYFSNSAINDYWFFLLLYPLANVLNNGADRFFIIYHKSNQLMLFKIRYGLTTFCVVIVAIIFKWSFMTYMIVFVSVEVFFAACIYYFIYRVTGIVPFGFDKFTCKKILTFAIPMGIAALISTINSELDKFVVGGLTDTETLAIYTNAAKELPITVFSTSISTVVMPFVVRNIHSGNRKGAVDIWKKSIMLSSYIMCFFMVAFFAFAPQVISVLYSDKYVAGVSVFRVYLITLVFRLTYYGMVLNATKHTNLILMSSIITMVANLILDYCFYNIMGITGPAWATVLSVAIMNIAQLIFTKRQIAVSFFDIYPVWHIVKIIILNSIMGCFMYIIQQFLFSITNFNENILTIGLGIIWTGIYFLIVRKNIISLWNGLNK